MRLIGFAAFIHLPPDYNRMVTLFLLNSSFGLKLTTPYELMAGCQSDIRIAYLNKYGS